MNVNRIVNSFYKSNTYVLSREGSPYVWLVDCGDYASQVRSILQSRYVRGVLLTHTHSDHIYGIKELLADFPEARIYTNEFGRMALGDPKLNLSRYHTEVPRLAIVCGENVIVVEEGSEIILDEGISAKVLFTPGHDKSCLSFIIEDNLFTGDAYIPGERLIANFPNSNKIEAVESYNRLEELGKSYVLCPGHGPMC